MKTLALLTAGLLLANAAPFFAQAPAPPDQRLREQLRTLMTQLRTAETERAALQAEKTNLEKKVSDLQKQGEELAKKMTEEQTAAKTAAERLRAEIAAREVEVSETKNLLVKADAFGKQSAELAKKTEAERSRLAAEKLQLQRVVSDQRVKNAKMFELGNEILTRYEKFGLGTAITAREPFVGITRARLEALAEDYRAQLAGQRIRLDGSSPSPSRPWQRNPRKQTMAPEKNAARNRN